MFATYSSRIFFPQKVGLLWSPARKTYQLRKKSGFFKKVAKNLYSLAFKLALNQAFGIILGPLGLDAEFQV